MVKNFNMAKYNGENAGAIVLMGQGAGRYPTASAVVRDLCGLGSLEMFRPDCVKVSADNSACVHSYYVRVDADKAARFSFRECRSDEACVRGVIEPIAVPAMHALADSVRKEGGSIFFAAMEA